MSLEAESLDRTSLLLPGQQQELVSQVRNASKGPVILVIFHLRRMMTRFQAFSGLAIREKLEELPLQMWYLQNTIQLHCLDCDSVFYKQQHHWATPDFVSDCNCDSISILQATAPWSNSWRRSCRCYKQRTGSGLREFPWIGYGNLGPNDVCTNENQQFSLEAASKV